MNIIFKKTQNKTYAYLNFREGKKVVQKYLGLASDPKIKKILQRKKETVSVPEFLKNLFWDSEISSIKIKVNARYIISRILEFGGLDSVEWLQSVYTRDKILDILLISRNISEKSKNFWLIWFLGDNDA